MKLLAWYWKGRYCGKTSATPIRENMATKVTYEMPVGNVEKIALRVTRRVQGKKFGELGVWQNEIGFKPTDHEQFFVVSWDELADFIKSKNRRGKKKAAAVKNEG